MNKDQEESKFEDMYKDGCSAYTALEKTQINRSFLEMRTELMESFVSSRFEESEVRTEAWRKMQTIAWLERCLTDITNNGKIAEVELKGFAKLKQKFTGK